MTSTKMLSTKPIPNYIVLIVAVVAALTQTACDGGAGGGDFNAPLSLRGVEYHAGIDTSVVPDPSVAPTEVNPGDLIVLKGENLNATQRLYFNGEEASFNSALTTSENLIVSVPGLPFGELDQNDETFNTIRVENRSSSATLDFPVLPSAPTVASINNEYPEPGEEVTLGGSAFYLAESLELPGGTTVPIDEVEIPENGGSATFTIPSGTNLEEGPIIYTTVAGTDTSSFHLQDTRGLLFNADDYNSWGEFNALLSTNMEYSALISEFRPGAEGEFAVLRGDTTIASGDGAWYSSNRAINLSSDQQWVAPENLDEAPGNFAVKFEINVREDWEAGTILIYLLETAEGYGSGYGYRYQPWQQPDGSVSSVSWDGWRTVTAPLSQFRTSAGTGTNASDIATLLGSDGVAGTGGPDDNPASFRLINYSDTVIPAGQAFAIDNIRVVRIAGGS